MNCRGQEGAAFRLLIAAIMGALILVIIVGIIAQLDSLKIQVSLRQVYSGMQSASQTPNADIVIRKDLTFAAGSVFLASTFADEVKAEKDCIELLSNKTAAFDVSDEGDSIKIKKYLVTDVFFRCFAGYAAEECRPGCDLFCQTKFGANFASREC